MLVLSRREKSSSCACGRGNCQAGQVCEEENE